MRILIATGIFRPEPGGPSTVAYELATRLRAQNHIVSVITYSNAGNFPADKELTFPLIRIVRKNKLSNYLRYFFALLKLLPKHDVVYTLDSFSAGMPVLLATTFLHKKYIVRVGGAYTWEKYLSDNNPPLTLKEFYAKGLYKNYKVMTFIINRVFHRAACIIFNTDVQRRMYEHYYKLDPVKLITIYNATPEHRFGNLLKTFKQETNLNERDKEIVFWGRFIKMKNVESLIQAFSKLRDLSYKLLLIGEGPTEQELHALVEKLDIAHRVTFMKPLSHKELFRRIANCAYVVIPSWTDISPHQAYECLAQSIPFLITEENYLSINSEDFLKIDPRSVDDIAEKMNNVLDPEKYVAFVSQLEKIEFSHSWSLVVEEHMRVFKKVYKIS